MLISSYSHPQFFPHLRPEHGLKGNTFCFAILMVPCDDLRRSSFVSCHSSSLVQLRLILPETHLVSSKASNGHCLDPRSFVNFCFILLLLLLLCSTSDLAITNGLAHCCAIVSCLELLKDCPREGMRLLLPLCKALDKAPTLFKCRFATLQRVINKQMKHRYSSSYLYVLPVRNYLYK